VLDEHTGKVAENFVFKTKDLVTAAPLSRLLGNVELCPNAGLSNASRIARQRLECARLLALLLAARANHPRTGFRSWTDSGDASPHSKRCRACDTGIFAPAR